MRRPAMWRSLVLLTLLLVGGVVLALGALAGAWMAEQDRRGALEDARRQLDAAEAQLRAQAGELLRVAREVATGLSESHSARLRTWIENEPLGLYRDARDPERVDIQAVMDALVAEVRQRGREEAERIQLLGERVEAVATARLEAAMARERAAADARAGRQAEDRRARLMQNLLLLLCGMAVLLALTLAGLVVRPVRRLRAAVDRIAAGDLGTPVPLTRRGAEELAALARAVERMRQRLLELTAGLEAEVRRKTEDLERTLGERTAALAELGATQERLVQAAKMAGLGTLAGGVAHEFNNLLGGILGCLESARAEPLPAAARGDLEVAERTAQRAAALVRALLDVARPGTRALVPVALGRVLDDVLHAAAPSAQRRRVALVREPGPEVTVLGDEGQLHQVALNLVANALQAVDDGERIWVALRAEGGQGVLEVRDEGPGIPPADRARVFEPFFTARPGGTGLGLFVSYGIVERHGGRIEVGEAPEGGAVFRVWIPLAAPGSRPAAH